MSWSRGIDIPPDELSSHGTRPAWAIVLKPDGVRTYILTGSKAGAVSAKYISTGAENCPMPICRATVSPPMAAAPMPIGMAFEGSEFMIGDTIGPYEGKIF
jgi:hypothetical protein